MREDGQVAGVHPADISTAPALSGATAPAALRRHETTPSSEAPQALTALLTLPGPLLNAQDTVQLDVLTRLLGVPARDGPLPDAVQLGGALALQRPGADTGPGQTGQGDGLAVGGYDVALGVSRTASDTTIPSSSRMTKAVIVPPSPR